MIPKTNTLNHEELQKWAQETVIFSLPLLLIFAQALQNGVPMKDALIAVYGAFLNALINLLMKYKQGTA